MRTILLPLFLILMSLPAFAAADWHDDIISQMNSEKNVERALVVDRDPETGKIRQANYRYTFKQKSLYKALRSKLLARENEAANFILRPGDEGQIIMKFIKPDIQRNYSLSHAGNKYLLVISAGSGEQSVEPANNQSHFQPDNVRRQAESVRQEAERTRQEAERVRQKAERARQQAERARQQAERARQRAEQAKQRSSSSSTTQTVTVFDNNASASQDITTRLKAAEAERKRLLRDK